MKKIRSALLAFGLLLVAVPSLSAQSVRDLVLDMLERQDRRMASVENYTVVQEAQGFQMKQYYEAREIEGRRVFVITETWAGGQRIGDMDEEPSDPFATFEAWIDSAELEGSESVDGHDTWVVFTDDLEAMSGPALSQGEAVEGTIRLYLDKEEAVLRRMVFEGVINDGSGNRDVRMTANMTDYRNVDGVLHPFDMSVSVAGAVSEQEAAEMQEQLKEMEAQLEQLPPAIRGQVEAQLEQLRSAAGGGEMGFNVKTIEVLVNQGPPQG